MFKVKVTSYGEELQKLNSKVEIGFLPGLNADVILKAAEHEFGAIGIPERSFMRSAFDENEDDIINFIKKLIPSALLGRLPEHEFMRKIGQYVKDIIVYKINTAKSWAKPLSPITIAKKGHDTPLVETYEMITSIKFKVD